MTNDFISVIYFEGMALAFSDHGDVLEFSPRTGRWFHRIDGPGREFFQHAVWFEDAILLFGQNGIVWKLDAHRGVPSCDWTWTRVSGPQ